MIEFYLMTVINLILVGMCAFMTWKKNKYKNELIEEKFESICYVAMLNEIENLIDDNSIIFDSEKLKMIKGVYRRKLAKVNE